MKNDSFEFLRAANDAFRFSASARVTIRIETKTSNYFHSGLLLSLILTTAACSSQNEPIAQADPVHPILRWIGIGLLVILALGIAIYILFQIYEGLVQRDLSYSIGGVLGFITGLIIGGLIDRENGTWTILALPGMYIGDYFLKIKFKARGLIAFIIGLLWLGVFILFIGAMILVVQENTSWF